MAYKNSGAMKFNDATDLIIRADENGTVESCFNRADNTEYVSPLVPVLGLSVTIKNNTSINRGVSYCTPTIIDDYNTFIPSATTIPAGESRVCTMAKGTGAYVPLTNTFTITSGDGITAVNLLSMFTDGSAEINE